MSIRAVLLTSIGVVVLGASAVQADPARFSGTLRILASTGLDPSARPVVTIPIQGTADISGGVVVIPAGAIQGAVPNVAGFGGTLVNGAGVFLAGGAGPGSTCPAIAVQEVCIEGGGFGGVMPLDGLTHLGQPLVAWGDSASATGMTAGGVVRREQSKRWTRDGAEALYYIPEIDATPFAIQEVGTFMGLPATAAGAPGFSLVSPKIVTSQALPPSSLTNVRVVVRLDLDFLPPPVVPIGGAAILSGALLIVALRQLTSNRIP